MHQLSAEARTTYVAAAIVEMLRHTPDLAWQDIVAVNDGPGWEYELPWYEQDSPLGPAGPELVRGERLERLDLVRAWYLARERTYH